MKGKSDGNELTGNAGESNLSRLQHTILFIGVGTGVMHAYVGYRLVNVVKLADNAGNFHFFSHPVSRLNVIVKTLLYTT